MNILKRNLEVAPDIDVLCAIQGETNVIPGRVLYLGLKVCEGTSE